MFDIASSTWILPKPPATLEARRRRPGPGGPDIQSQAAEARRINNSRRFRMNAAVLGLLFAFGLAEQVVAEGEKFNLDCTGTVSQSDPISRRAETVVPWSGRIRVDLGSNLFCLDDCQTAETIAVILPEMLALRDKQNGAYPDTRDVVGVSRKTGKYFRDHWWIEKFDRSTSYHEDKYSGFCTPSNFTEFPKTLF